MLWATDSVVLGSSEDLYRTVTPQDGDTGAFTFDSCPHWLRVAPKVITSLPLPYCCMAKGKKF